MCFTAGTLDSLSLLGSRSSEKKLKASFFSEACEMLVQLSDRGFSVYNLGKMAGGLPVEN